jgi:hypothetical protein
MLMTLERKTLIVEPMAIIATISLLTAWAIQPLVAHAVAQQGLVAQATVASALWLSAIVSPFSAFAKAASAALVCWAVAVYLGEQLPVKKLVSAFCVAEVLFSLRDLGMLAALAIRGTASIRSTGDLAVSFGPSAFLHSTSMLTRIAFESWDFFHIAWGLLLFCMLHAMFEIGRRSSAYLAIATLAFRVLFAAAGLLYGI